MSMAPLQWFDLDLYSCLLPFEALLDANPKESRTQVAPATAQDAPHPPRRSEPTGKWCRRAGAGTISIVSELL